MTGHAPGYHAYHRASSARAANVVVPMLAACFDVRSVVDFGCGTGTWLQAWQALGLHDVVGCDLYREGDTTTATCAVPIVLTDLSRPVRLGRRFDLAQSLEVAEHLPGASAGAFVDTLVVHAPVVVFSAAVPGQGGEHHVNERPLEFWRRLFRERGYVALDAVRPRLIGRREVAPWYRRNMLAYVDAACVERLPGELQACLVPDRLRLREYTPWLVRGTRWPLRCVPEPVVTAVAALVRQVTRG